MLTQNTIVHRLERHRRRLRVRDARRVQVHCSRRSRRVVRPDDILELVPHPLDYRSNLVIARISRHKRRELHAFAQFPLEQVALVEKDDKGSSGE